MLKLHGSAETSAQTSIHTLKIQHFLSLRGCVTLNSLSVRSKVGDFGFFPALALWDPCRLQKVHQGHVAFPERGVPHVPQVHWLAAHHVAAQSGRGGLSGKDISVAHWSPPDPAFVLH